ncbi:HpaII family restriction endonuclease [Cellulophaga sp. BC115SP]|uniref:HpaII family restriction endonuclease n=1 Tax=Cellulophaga sp. BC115SP TaxID=2683263 RepID=UPI0014129D86|nr:HpaII family restriction endonuclease [Cellulophaga sp. BC115SP]NBB31790.1 HpaII family restriction endonuclease [Cellulophaga sp. BC115SP]
MFEAKFKFIDLFAGIGGFHLAMHRLGGECVFASEMDQHARKTYETNFSKISPFIFENELFNADIRTITPSDIPDFDVLCAGFPCQPFSQAGHKRGFEDNHNSERGNLFFNIVDIIEAKQPKAFFLENVRGIVNHDNGRTFKVIRQILQNELGYSFYFKIVNACDYGLPQLRPRAFMIGFKNDSFLNGFTFPEQTPLKFTMSDVWEGKCSRDIGFTLRVGGRGSDISDKRNWDSYLVDGVVRKLSYVQAKRMQGFPEDFDFPVSPTQAIKQLGNSVAIDAVEAVGRNMIKYLDNLQHQNDSMKKTKNKGEWTELLVFVKLLLEKKVFLSDSELQPKLDVINLNKVTSLNINSEFHILDEFKIDIVDKQNGTNKTIELSQILDQSQINLLTNSIKENSSTFEIPEFKIIQDELGFTVIKGGNSNQKSDIVLDGNINQQFEITNEGFGIKSYLGAKPTLLNASGNTNFIFQVEGIDSARIDEVNSIDTSTKLRDRIMIIEEYGGSFKFIAPEKDTLNYNLKLIDSLMPEIVGEMLLTFYKDRVSSIEKNINSIHKKGELKSKIGYEDDIFLTRKVEELLVGVLLGFFAGTKWDGKYESKGTIVMKNQGDIVAFHIIDIESLKSYLFNHIKFDTPSTTRHRFGKLYLEKDGKLYFKLNLQLRF